MSGVEILTALLLGFAALVSLLSGLGVLAMKGFHDKLHYLAPPAVLGTAAIVVAVLLQEGLNTSSVKALLVLFVLVISNPVLTYAAARADHLRKEKK